MIALHPVTEGRKVHSMTAFTEYPSLRGRLVMFYGAEWLSNRIACLCFGPATEYRKSH
jgi:hypothetical protein